MNSRIFPVDHLSSSGVTNTGLNAVAGLELKNPKPFCSSFGIRFLKLTSLAIPTRRTYFSASSFLVD